jgi:hypothetical protein
MRTLSLVSAEMAGGTAMSWFAPTCSSSRSTSFHSTSGSLARLLRFRFRTLSACRSPSEPGRPASWLRAMFSLVSCPRFLKAAEGIACTREHDEAVVQVQWRCSICPRQDRPL